MTRRNHHIVNVSGGKDSDATYLKACERGRPFRPVFSDTGNEHEFTYEHIEKLPERTGGPKVEVVKQDFSAAIARRRERLPVQWSAVGVPQDLIDRALSVMHPTGIPYLDLVLAKGMFAAGAKRKFCTEELKIRPTQEQIIDPLIDAGDRVVQWLGIRADESVKRADKDRHPKYQKLGRFTPPTIAWNILLYRPILDWTIADVVEIHRKHGLPLNPLYGLGFSRVGCFPCINERKAGMAIIARRFPEELDRIREWEAIASMANVAWQKQERFLERDICTFFPSGKVPNLHRNTIDDVALWATTSRGGRQQDILAGLIPDEGHFACTGGMGWCEQ